MFVPPPPQKTNVAHLLRKKIRLNASVNRLENAMSEHSWIKLVIQNQFECTELYARNKAEDYQECREN